MRKSIHAKIIPISVTEEVFTELSKGFLSLSWCVPVVSATGRLRQEDPFKPGV